MLLTIDIGNTNTVLGIFDGEELVDSWRVKTDARDTADELWILWRCLLLVTQFPVSQSVLLFQQYFAKRALWLILISEIFEPQ